MFCVPESVNGFNARVAPLLGLLSLFSLHIIYTILFIDVIVAPLGTGNAYTAVSGRVLQAFGLILRESLSFFIIKTIWLFRFYI